MHVPWLQLQSFRFRRARPGKLLFGGSCNPDLWPVPTAFDDPYALVVLAEEELVVIDLQTPGWPPVQPPYLASLHCSAITCSHHVSNIPLKLWERIIAAGSRQNTHFSTMVSPAPRPALRAPRPPGPGSLLTVSVVSPRSGPLTVAPAWPRPRPRGTCCSRGRWR